jgi:hypothetical protein
MQSVSLPTSVGHWNKKMLWLKQTTNFEITEYKNIKIIISNELKPIHAAIV